MTPPPLPDEEDDEALAAEYVIGLLALDERKDTERRIREDAVFAARVAGWEARLDALNEDYGSMAPPDRVKTAIDRRLFETAPPRRRALAWLGGLGLVAAGLVLAVMLGLFTPQTAPALRATLQGEEPAYRFDVALTVAPDRLQVTLAAGAAPAPQVFELWLVPASGVPQSLGVFEAGTAAVLDAPETLGPGSTLAVSLEPAGGSPTGAPTGPVLAVGTLEEL